MAAMAIRHILTIGRLNQLVAGKTTLQKSKGNASQAAPTYR